MFNKISLLFVMILTITMTSISASAQCTQWRPPSAPEMGLTQSNANVTIFGIKRSVNLKNTYRAQARRSGLLNIPVTGDVDLTVDGDNVSMKIFWTNRETGMYVGKIARTGRAEGESWEIKSPNSKVHWSLNPTFDCVVQGTLRPNAKGGGGGSTPGSIYSQLGSLSTNTTGGGSKSSSGSKPATPKATVPGGAAIIASPKTMVVGESEKTGKTTITWDHGPNVNYAELWVQIDDEKEKYLSGEQTATSKEFDIVPYRTYVFFLKSSKKRIASVTVKFTR